MIKDFALGLRLAVGGGRISGSTLLRLAMTTIGIALAVAILLPAASFGNVANEREARQAAAAEIAEPVSGVDPLLRQSWSLEFHGHNIYPKVIAATGPTSPVPPGLDRLPAPGEVWVSPAVQEILDSPDGAAFRGRIPGNVVGVIGKPGVTDPGDETMFVGARPDQLTGEKKTDQVYGFGRESEGFQIQALLLLLAPAAVVLLLPLLVFVTTASRMGAAQRDRRLATLRLIGLDAHQIRRVAAGESLVGAMAGLVLGAGLFLVLRSQIGNLNMFGLRVYGDDFVPQWPLALLIVVLVPALTIGSALFGLRRTIVEPLGVVRIGKPKQRRMWWRWTIVILGGGLMISTLFAEKRSDDTMVILAVTAGSALSLIGMAAVLPWAVERLVRGISGGTPSWQLAIRRLQLDSGTASRVVSGLVVVLAGSILIQALVASLSQDLSTGGDQPYALGSASVQVSADTTQIGEAAWRTRAAPGITQVEVIHSAYAKQAAEASTTSVEIGDCAALAILAKLPSCTDGDTFFVDDDPTAPDGSTTVAPTGAVRISDSYQGSSGDGREWTVPGTLRHIPAADGTQPSSGSLLVTPAALGNDPITAARSTLYVGGDGTPDEVVDRVGTALSPLSWKASVHTIFGYDFQADNDRAAQQIRSVLLFVSVFVLSIAALSLLMLSVEQITERRRPLAALSAAGVPVSVLAKGSLWQTAIPVGVGVILAVATGIGVTAPILRISGMPIIFDIGGIGTLVVAAILVVLVVTALTLPLLRSVTRLDGLRAE